MQSGGLKSDDEEREVEGAGGCLSWSSQTRLPRGPEIFPETRELREQAVQKNVLSRRENQ